jgi:hypothetical protein
MVYYGAPGLRASEWLMMGDSVGDGVGDVRLHESILWRPRPACGARPACPACKRRVVAADVRGWCGGGSRR